MFADGAVAGFVEYGAGGWGELHTIESVTQRIDYSTVASVGDISLLAYEVPGELQASSYTGGWEAAFTAAIGSQPVIGVAARGERGVLAYADNDHPRPSHRPRNWAW